MLRTLAVFALSLVATFASSVLASSQVPSSQTDATMQAPTATSIAFVYVSTSHGGNTYEVSAYAAASNGQLTPISGSPFAANVQNMALNKTYLFGTNGIDIYSFSIAANGALTQVATINAQSLNQGSCGGPESLFLDRTGATVYDPDYLGNICANNAYQSFGIDASTGALTYLGAAVASPAFNAPLNFIGNNVYGYSSACYHFYPSIFGYMRNSDETLTQLSITPAIPAAPAGQVYCPYLAASDRANNVAVPFTPLNSYTWQPAGPPQLAVYSADSSGNLTTRSTATNMVKTAVNSVLDIRISPSGKLIAAAGTTGLQVFHFNGANPITHFTALLTTDQVDHIFWDNANHLYAISNSAGKLFVFTVTSTTVTPAPGSPYTITGPQDIVVLPK
jgi:hypothetical protein